MRSVYRNDVASIDKATGRVQPTAVVCAEPSPDVAIALGESSSIGANASGLENLVPAAAAGSAVTPGNLGLALSLATAQAEALAQLGERLATIQILRDGLYRACEAYANGAISPTTYTILVSRIDELLVTLLAQELAAGAFGRQLATIQASTSANTSSAETVSSQSAANTQATPVGPLSASAAATNADTAGHIGEIQKSYLGELNFDALIIACISELSNATSTGVGTRLADKCEQSWSSLTGIAERIIEKRSAREDAAVQAELARAVTARNYSEALLSKCGAELEASCVGAVRESFAPPGQD